MLRVALLLALGSAGASDRLYKAAWPAITEAYFRKVLDESGDAELTYVGRYGVTVLMAVVNNHDWPEQVAALLDRGANASATSHGDMTALHLAAGHNRTRAARVLLEYGAEHTVRGGVDNLGVVDLAGGAGTPVADYIKGLLDGRGEKEVAKAKVRLRDLRFGPPAM